MSTGKEYPADNWLLKGSCKGSWAGAINVGMVVKTLGHVRLPRRVSKVERIVGKGWSIGEKHGAEGKGVDGEAHSETHF